MAGNVGDFDRGRFIGKYEIVTRLSVGGMAELYLAFLPGPGGFKKFVAVKQILPDVKADQAFVQMFLDEARITAAFAHPNIGQVFDLGEDPSSGELYLAMEFIAGQNLEQVIRRAASRQVPIPVGFVARVLRDACLGLHYAHTFKDPSGQPMAVVHRDVSPKNVMITYAGQVKMIDFGIAKARGRLNRTQVGIVKGTNGYMAPEQVRNEPLDGRTDLFAVGVMLHELLCGERLFRAPSDAAMMLKIVQEEPRDPSSVNPEVSNELSLVTMKALAKDREVRFSTGKDFARALELATSDLFDDEQLAEFMAHLFDDKIAATRALLDVAKSGPDAERMDQAVEGLVGAEEADSRARKSPPQNGRGSATPVPRVPPRISVSKLPRVATGNQRARAPSGGTGKSARLVKPSKQELPPVPPDDDTAPPKSRPSSRRLNEVPPKPVSLELDDTARPSAVERGGSLVGPLAIVGVLVLLAVGGWAAAFGPFKEQARSLLKGEAEEPVVDRGPRPVDITAGAKGPKPAWLLEKEAETRRLLAERARQQEIEEAANDPARQEMLREIDAQIQQLNKLEEEQHRLTVEARQGKATGEANSKKIDDLQKQIDDLKRAIDLRQRGGHPKAGDPGEVQIVKDEKSARAAEVGYLSLRTVNPSSAAVFLEDSSLGSTPLTKVPLEVGLHSLRVVDGESKSRTLSVLIEAGKTKEFQAIDVTSLPAAP